MTKPRGDVVAPGRGKQQGGRGAECHLERGLGNCAATGIDQLTGLVKTRLKRLRYRPELLDSSARSGLFSSQSRRDRHRP